MNAAQCENVRNTLRSVIANQYQTMSKGERWDVQIIPKSNGTAWMSWGNVHKNDIKTHLNFLRSAYPEFKFRAVRQIEITYKRTLIKY